MVWLTGLESSQAYSMTAQHATSRNLLDTQVEQRIFLAYSVLSILMFKDKTHDSIDSLQLLAGINAIRPQLP